MASNTLISAQERADTLQDGLVAVITGDDIENRYFDQLGRVWKDQETGLKLGIEGMELDLNEDTIKFLYGCAIGKSSGIIPYIAHEDSSTGKYREIHLTVNEDNEPNFRIQESLGLLATRSIE